MILTRVKQAWRLTKQFAHWLNKQDAAVFTVVAMFGLAAAVFWVGYLSGGGETPALRLIDAWGDFLGSFVGGAFAVGVAAWIISHERHEMRKDRVLPAAYAARGVLLELNERFREYSYAIEAVGVIERHREEDEASSQQFVQFRVNMLKNFFADIPFRDLSRSDQILLSMHTRSGLTY